MSEQSQQLSGYELAIVGMAGVFPGAKNIEQFWQNLSQGKESIRTLSDDELTAAGVSIESRQQSDFQPRVAALDDAFGFDAGFFGYSPREAEVLDPQQRLFLETCWHALEHAGYVPEKFSGSIGVYASSGSNSYLIDCLRHRQSVFSQVTMDELNHGNNSDFVSTRVAYKLGLNGPAMTIGAACASSLVALHHACQGLLLGECDMALAGGVHIGVPDKVGYHSSESGILSRDGSCRPFDARASGTVGGDGSGVVALRRLQDAIDARDSIIAVIKGSAISNDGSRKLGFTAPSVPGQVESIKRALVASDVEAQSIGYVEAHGTGTELGDPIEIEALKTAYQSDESKWRCAVASVKANVGHLDAAAGVAGIIKAAMVLQNQYIPPAVNFETLNPKIELDHSPFFIPKQGEKWESEHIRRAGVSAFGVGGTNAHVILEESCFNWPCEPAHLPQLWCVSAQSQSALQANIAQLHQWLKAHPQANLANVAFTLMQGRRDMVFRHSFLAKDIDQMLRELSLPQSAIRSEKSLSMVFMFSGQGSQYRGMMAPLYQHAPRFTQVVDECAGQLQSILDLDIRTLMFDAFDGGRQDDALYQTQFTQPALFVVEYALSQQLMDWGIQPNALIGHSIGEYVAACLAGVFSLSDALQLVCMRGSLMGRMPAGQMVAVYLGVDEVQPYLVPHTSVAANNAPGFCVVSGTDEAMPLLIERLQKDDIEVKPLQTSHAFHSEMMDGCLDEYRRCFDQVVLHPPKLPFISCVSGDWITDDQAISPDYWVQQLRHPVAFCEGIQVLLARSNSILLEVGPGKVLTGLTSLQLGDQKAHHRVIHTQPEPRQYLQAYNLLLGALGKIWESGVIPDWQRFMGGARARVALPGYPFEHQHYELKGQSLRQPDSLSTSGERLDLDQWAHQPCWQQKPAICADLAAIPGQSVLLFMDNFGVCESLVQELLQAGCRVQKVYKGRQFICGHDKFTLNPASDSDLSQLVDELNSQGFETDVLVYAESLSTAAKLRLSQATEHYETLLELARQFGRQLRPLNMICLTNHQQAVLPTELCDPARSLMIGPCRVISKEFEQIHCRCIDIDLPVRSRLTQAKLPRLAKSKLTDFSNVLFHELFVDDVPVLVAYRQGIRYQQGLEVVKLNAVEHSDLPLRSQGCYLITGGFGGIGMTFAKWLAKYNRAHLILLGRTELPASEHWQQWLANHSQNNRKSQMIRQVQALEQLGAKVHAVAVDISNDRLVHKELKQAEAQFGVVHGVFHCAGVADGGLILQRQRDDSSTVFRAKVFGTQTVEHYFRRHHLDFFVQCSSLAASIGPMRQVAYCSANAYQEAWSIAQTKQNHHQTRYLSIGWDSWNEVGMAVDSINQWYSGESEQVLSHGIRSDEGCELFARLLARQEPQYVISTRGLPLPDADSDYEPADELKGDDVRPTLYPRPDLGSEFVAPGDTYESTIASIWEAKIGVGPLGIHDDFFELNGHSLMAVQIVAQIKQELGIKFPVGVLYDYPTIARLCELVREQVSVMNVKEASYA
ncbi:MAG: hypothetical protein CENE_03173 [Candidatus Celerinatantimonas neptuna]|nr:MAG: hypothetical protein CENE_03173 [Candidatus Celerinatantimonas neptuna]